MEDHLYGRLTTLNRLKAVRDDPNKSKLARLSADRAMQKIQTQLKDRRLMALRERLIKATRAKDYSESWRIENQIRAYEGTYTSAEDQE